MARAVVFTLPAKLPSGLSAFPSSLTIDAASNFSPAARYARYLYIVLSIPESV